jgi:hypothetical protein
MVRQMAKRVAYSFRIAYQTEEQLAQEGQSVDPSTLVLTILPDGLPSYKTLHASGESEEEALAKVEAYVSKTPYRDIEDGKMVS